MRLRNVWNAATGRAEKERTVGRVGQREGGHTSPRPRSQIAASSSSLFCAHLCRTHARTHLSPLRQSRRNGCFFVSGAKEEGEDVLRIWNERMDGYGQSTTPHPHSNNRRRGKEMGMMMMVVAESPHKKEKKCRTAGRVFTHRIEEKSVGVAEFLPLTGNIWEGR